MSLKQINLYSKFCYTEQEKPCEFYKMPGKKFELLDDKLSRI